LIAQALDMYRKAEVLNDATIDSEACQLALAAPHYGEEDIERLLRRWSFRHMMHPNTPNLVRGQFAHALAKRPITVAYHCIFWGSFTAEALALPFIARHDRSAFRVIGYSPFDEAPDVQRCFDAFHGGMKKHDNEAFARHVRSEAVDVFVEISGLSPYHRFGAMALRCAPIQVSYVNHLATTQVANVDYIIGDEIAFPPGCDIYYSERIHRLRRCLLAYSYDAMNMPEVAGPPFLKNGYVTFGSFGGPYKLNAQCIRLWAAVLTAVPGSRFLMQNDGMSKRSNAEFIAQQFRRFGVASDRLTILPGTDRDSNLRNYAAMDISLDSWPYCGGNSVAEALWSGVPVVTLRGARPVTAYGASLLSAAGLADLVARSDTEYVEIARNLAADTERLTELRHKLRDMMRENGLSDATGMARALEEAYVAMVARRFGGISRESSAPGATREISASSLAI
jgi:predicted O-linked N-acetylglucosamine transferase (SPINDLY family)